MSGRIAVPVFQYDKNGKFIRKYDSNAEVFDKYFEGKKGRLFHNGSYKMLPDGTVVCNYRAGRGAKKLFKIEASPFCRLKKLGNDNKPFSVYNLLKKKLGSFESVGAFSLLTGHSASAVQNKLQAEEYTSGDLIFKYDIF